MAETKTAPAKNRAKPRKQRTSMVDKVKAEVKALAVEVALKADGRMDILSKRVERTVSDGLEAIQRKRDEEIEEFKARFRRDPWFAVCMWMAGGMVGCAVGKWVL